MRLLFDENTPFSLAAELAGHECNHVIRMGWRGVKNGVLLSNAEQAGFDVLVTLDDDMGPEQNMLKRNIAVLVIKPAGQGNSAIKAMSSQVLLALSSIRPGEIRVIDYRQEQWFN